MPLHDNRVVLLVEDSAADAYATQRGLRKSGLANPIVHVTTGEAALDYLHQRGDYAGEAYQGLPSVVLLDLNLPGIDGAEVLEHVRAHEPLKLLPVVMLTTSEAPEDVERVYRAGASSYVCKPVDLDRFMDAIRRLREYWFEVVVLPRVDAR